MPQSIREVMTPNPVSLPGTTSLIDAACRMKDDDIGDVLVVDGDELRGLVTDRDIVVRAVAEGRDAATTTLGDVCSAKVVCLGPADALEDAVRLMSEHAVRRLPIVDTDGRSASCPSGISPSSETRTRPWPTSAPRRQANSPSRAIARRRR